MKVPLIDLHAQYMSLKKEILQSIERVLDSGVYISGNEVMSLEEEMSTYTNSKYAISTANGTDSLVLALEACGVGMGDEVITSPYTFFASAEAIARVGATPVFADIDSRTYNLSPESAERRITKKTKAIIPVHIFGQPAEMDAFMELGKRYNLFIIEDACQALGATYKGRKVGSIGDVGCISFFPTKNLGGYGDGGIVLTKHESIAEKIRLLGHHGSRKKYFHEIVGFNSRLDAIQAAILRIKLKKLDEWNRLRQDKAIYYNIHLKDKGLVVPYASTESTHVYHLYLIQTDRRAELTSHLHREGVATGHYYPVPIHLQKAFCYLGYTVGDLPVSEELCKRAVSLPLFPEMTVDQQSYVISKVTDYFK